MRVITPVDVASGDLGDGDVIGRNSQIGAVVRLAQHPLDRSRKLTVKLDDLTATGVGILGVAGRLAVHADIVGCLLNHAIGLGSDDVRVLGETDVERLTGATQGQLKLVRCGRRARTDGHGTFERRDRAPERLRRPKPLTETPARERRDDLGIGGDGRCDRHALLGDQIGEVVDIAVERADDIGAGSVEQLAVERVSIRLGDDADRRPTGVAEHQGAGGFVGERSVQQRVVGERLADHRRVVAELADLGSGLVHDAQDPVDDANRAGAEVGVARTSGDLGGDHRIVEVERMVVNEDVQAGAIAAADLEPIDRRQGLVDRQASLERAGLHRTAVEAADDLGGPKSVAGDRPHPIANGDQSLVAGFELARRKRAVLLESLFLLLDRSEEFVAVVHQRRAQAGLGQKEAETGDTPQEGVGFGKARTDPRNGVGGIRAGDEQGGLTRDEIKDRLARRRCSCRRAPDYGDDPAHRCVSPAKPGCVPSRVSAERSLGPSPGRQGSAEERLDGRDETIGLHPGLGIGFGFDHDPDERFGARGSNQHTAPAGHAGERCVDKRGERPIDVDRPPGDPDVPQHLRQAGHRRVGQRAERAPSARHDVEQLHRREEAITGRCELAEDHVAGLFATERISPCIERLQHVAVADLGIDNVDAGVVHRPPETEVGHDGDDDRITSESAAGLGVECAHGDDLITVDQTTIGVDREEPVCVTVEGDAEVGAALDNSGLQRRWMGRPTPVVDVGAVGSGMEHRHVGTEANQRPVGDVVRRTVRRIGNDDESGEAAPLEAGDNAVDVRLGCDVMGVHDRRNRLDLGSPQRVETGLDLVLHPITELRPTGGEEFDAVVVPRIVRRRDHRSGNLMIGTPSGDCRSRHNAEIDGIAARGGDTSMHGTGELRTRGTGISTDSEATVTEDLRSRLRKGADGRRSQFGAGITPHAVGSEGQRHGIIIGRRRPKAMDRREARPAARSALAVLRRLAGLLEAVLLAFLLARIAGEEAGRLEGATVLGVEFDKATSDPEAQRTSLAGGATAMNGGVDVVGLAGLGDGERLEQRLDLHLRREELVDRTAIDGDGAGAVAETHAGDGTLATAGGLGERSGHLRILVANQARAS